MVWKNRTDYSFMVSTTSFLSFSRAYVVLQERKFALESKVITGSLSFDSEGPAYELVFDRQVIAVS